MNFLTFLEKHLFNPMLVYVVSLITVLLLTNFDTTSFIATAVISVFMMLPIYLLFAILAAIFIY
jgi:hypothetical protein